MEHQTYNKAPNNANLLYSEPTPDDFSPYAQTSLTFEDMRRAVFTCDISVIRNYILTMTRNRVSREEQRARLEEIIAMSDPLEGTEEIFLTAFDAQYKRNEDNTRMLASEAIEQTTHSTYDNIVKVMSTPETHYLDPDSEAFRRFIQQVEQRG